MAKANNTNASAKRITTLIAAENDLQETLNNLAEQVKEQLQSAGIKQFTLADGRAMMDHWRAKDPEAKAPALRKRLQRFRTFLESIGVKVVKDKRGGARKTKDEDAEGQDEPKGSGRPSGSSAAKEGPDISKGACQQRVDDLLAAIAAKGGPGSKEARVHLKEVAQFLGLDI